MDSKRTIKVLQHSDHTPPGTIGDWANARGLSLDVYQLHNGAALPQLNQDDFVIVLGGPMSVWEVEAHPWLLEEKKLLREFAQKQGCALGLCLGGQLFSEVLGGQVKPSGDWEVGWHEVDFLGPTLAFAPSGQKLHVFQYHQDVFSLPPGAQCVAENAFSKVQGFSAKHGSGRIIGLQYHPEATVQFVREATEELPTGGSVQSPQEMLAQLERLEPQRQWFFALLDSFL